jgi:DNA-binding NtrC family response regulator
VEFSDFMEYDNQHSSGFEKKGKPYLNAYNMGSMSILVVDDNPSIRRLFERILAEDGFEILSAGSLEEAQSLLAQNTPNMAFIDLFLPDGNGIDLLYALKKKSPQMPIVVITGHGTIELAVEAMRAGAFDFLLKPLEHVDLIKLTAAKAIKQQKMIDENIDLKNALSDKYKMDRLVGKSPGMQRIFRIIRQLIDNESTILIHGESGTGKELLAQAIHYNSPRREQKFIPVDCGSLPETLIESELFGHLKGAFTDAYRDVKGLFREADHGTIFLDEIGELPMSMQAKLLRTLQEREVRPLGAATAVPVDVRVIAASKRDLKEMAQKGTFREDLFYRLNVVYLELPPLRERMEDISLLVNRFLDDYSQRTGRCHTFTPEAMQVLMKYPWPGNVRELQNCVEQALALVNHAEISPEDLPLVRENTSDEALPPNVALSFEAYEKLAIERALASMGGDIAGAAKILNVGVSTLYRKMKNLGIGGKKV